MSIVRRVALPCGILGGAWGLLAPVVVIVLANGASMALYAFLSFIVLMGALGLLSVVLSKRSHKLWKPLLWASAVAILLVSLIDIALGLIFLPASVLLLVAAIGLKKGQSGVRV